MPAERLVSIYDVDVCAFCGAIGVMHRCSWPAEKEVSIPASDLRVGDLVKLGPAHFNRVTEVVLSRHRRTVYYTLSTLSRQFLLEIEDAFEPTLRGLRVVPCAAACCEKCAVERAEGVHYCQEHWMEWRKVA